MKRTEMNTDVQGQGQGVRKQTKDRKEGGTERLEPDAVSFSLLRSNQGDLIGVMSDSHETDSAACHAYEGTKSRYGIYIAAFVPDEQRLHHSDEHRIVDICTPHAVTDLDGEVPRCVEFSLVRVEA